MKREVKVTDPTQWKKSIISVAKANSYKEIPEIPLDFGESPSKFLSCTGILVMWLIVAVVIFGIVAIIYLIGAL
jgi:hypothetical protein